MRKVITAETVQSLVVSARMRLPVIILMESVRMAVLLITMASSACYVSGVILNIS